MEENNNLQIELKPETIRGTYSNLAVITHSASEFILDFASMLPGMKQPEVISRLIMTPEHAKRLFLALNDNLKKYESTHGEIVLNEMRPFLCIASVRMAYPKRRALQAVIGSSKKIHTWAPLPERERSTEHGIFQLLQTSTNASTSF